MNLSIRVKLLAVLTLTLILLVTLGLFALREMSALRATTTRLASDTIPSLTAIRKLRFVLSRYRQLQAEYVAESNSQALIQIKTQLLDLEAQMDSYLQTYTPPLDNADQQAAFAQLQTHWAKFVTMTHQTLLSLSGTHDVATAIQAYHAMQPTYDQLIVASTTLEAREAQDAQEAIQETQATFDTSTRLIYTITLAAIVIATVLGFGLSAGIAQHLRQLTIAAAAVAAGDLAHEVTVRSNDEIGLLARTFNQMVAQIREHRAMLEQRHMELQQSLAERTRAEAALIEERTLLEQRVEERTAELRAANAELARAVRLKDEFLASMSHELRTPLNAILGLSEALEEQIYGPLDARQLATVQQIATSGRHLLDLINDILDLSKVEAGKIELELGDVAVARLCQESLQFVMAAATKKDVTVGEQIDPAVRTVRADARRLKQILVNLLSNAVKFTPARGSIGLEVVGDSVRQEVYFTVWDTGIGIAEVDMPRLFQPFVQLDSSLARAHPGTGLGLALVRRLTELHGGSVALESTVGGGSRFTIRLPWQGGIGQHGGQTATDQARATLPRSTPSSPAKRVLLVEDNELAVRTFSDYLRAKGYQIVVARDGQEAIVRAHEVDPDIILMDIQMPEMDGLEATRRIRAIPKLQATPIIATTALAMPGDRERCLAAGATAYLTKPMRLQELVATIEQLLDNH